LSENGRKALQCASVSPIFSLVDRVDKAEHAKVMMSFTLMTLALAGLTALQLRSVRDRMTQKVVIATPRRATSRLR
jgi:hypothetical protein